MSVLLRKGHDEFVGVGDFSGPFDLVARGMAGGVADVFGDGAVEQKNVLLDDAQQPAITFHFDIAQIDAVQLNRPGGGIVKPRHQIAQRRFARAAGTDQCDHLAGFSFEIDVAQHQMLVLRIVEADVSQAKCARRSCLRSTTTRAGQRWHFARLFQQIEHAVQAR